MGVRVRVGGRYVYKNENNVIFENFFSVKRSEFVEFGKLDKFRNFKNLVKSEISKI